MSPIRPQPRAGRRSVATWAAVLAGAGLLAGALVGAPASAIGASPSADALSHRLAALAAMSAPDSAAAGADRRSGLAGVDLSSTAVAERLSLPVEGPGSLLRDSDGRVLVQARFGRIDAGTRASLAAVGRVVDVAPRYERATLYVAPSDLGSLASIPGVVSVDVVPAPMTSRRAASGETTTAGASVTAATAAASCNPVVSEGDVQLRAALARTDFGVDGTGVKVGVLSDSYGQDESITSPAEDVASGDLPGPGNPCGRTTPVEVLDDSASAASPIDEGRAMLQIVHDLAPGATLAFATAMNGPDAMAANIRALAAAGATVIVDDVTYLDEPFFQSGVVDQAVEDVTRAGVTYFSSAGNSGVVVDGQQVGSWETARTRIVPCPKIKNVDTKNGCVDFGTGDPTYGVRVSADGSFTIDAQWAQPQYGVTTDFDLYVIDSSGNVLSESKNLQSKTQTAAEFLGSPSPASTTTYSVAIVRRSGTATPRLKLAFVSGDGISWLEYAAPAAGTGDVVGPTVFGHNGGAASVSVAAVPYDDASKVEDYSARGPQTYYFGPVTGLAPAAALAAPEVIPAPDLAATDGVRTTFFLTRIAKVWRFYGTSAAAPHAAAIAALLRQRDPGLSPAALTHVLQATARPVGTTSADAVGAGLVDAWAAVGAVAPLAAPKVTGVTAGVGSVTLRWSAVGSPFPVRYAVACTASGGHSGTASTAATQATVTGLTAGLAYRCTVRAQDGVRTSAAATSVSFVPTGRPGATPAPSVTPKRKKLVVRVAPPTATGGLPVLSYTVVCTAAKAPKRKIKITSSGPVVKIKQLVPGTTYKIKVKAQNAVGTGPTSPVVKIRTKP